ncbi:MAG: hypothetical protein AAF388_15655 [Bacteroidota bacterium]
MIKKLLYVFFLAIPCITFAQTDEINISASFAESIELRFTTSGDVSWTFSTINHYKNGFLPKLRIVDYEVSASVSFLVQCQITPMTNGNGDELSLGNISLRPGISNDYVADRGSRWEWAGGDRSSFTNDSGISRGDIFFGDKLASPRTIVVPGPSGNAGGFEKNRYKLLIGMGAFSQTKLNSMPTMLDQNISPGVYTGTILLTALADVN